MTRQIVFVAIVAAVLFSTLLANSMSFAQSQTTITPIDGIIGIEKTTIPLTISDENTLPWAFVEGKIGSPVPGHPVIIQIYDNEGVSYNDYNAFHFAQVNVASDGSYEYKFRVFNIDDGAKINIFDGDYTVKIFKTVYLDSDIILA